METILIVEDGDVIRTMLAELLAAEGYRVLEASDGKRAIELAEGQTSPIELLVTDMVMPTCTGREVATELMRRFPKMRVLYMSGYSSERFTEALSPKLGAEFLEKPFRPAALLDKVRTILTSYDKPKPDAPRP